MDVTLLLNSNGATTLDAEQQDQKKEENKRPFSRTPWDAGGYSLPINTVSISQSPFYYAQDEGGLRREAPAQTSPTQHRFSDSRSSLSSFTSSLQSATHSRFSSMSTVYSSSNLMQSFVPMDGITPDTRKASDSLDFSAFYPNGDVTSGASSSPTNSVNTIEIDAQQRPTFQNLCRQESTKQEDLFNNQQREASTVTELASQRSTSPSDAVLIKRTAVPLLRLDTGDTDLESASEHKS